MSQPATPTYGRRASIQRQTFSLTETYSDKDFLRKLDVLKETPSVEHWRIANDDKLYKELKTGIDLAVTYEQKEYPISDGISARIGRYYNSSGKKHVVSAQNLGRDIMRLTMKKMK